MKKSALIIIENEKEERLFLLRNINPFGWAFPGGKLKDGETSEDAVIRELKEETGIELDKEMIKFSHTGKSINGMEVDVYSVVLDHTPDVKINKKEHLNKRWIKESIGLQFAGNTILFLENLNSKNLGY